MKKIAILNGFNNLQYNPLLTYTLRFKKMSFQPNFTGNYTIEKHREKEFINGYIALDSPEKVDKVINTI